MHACGVLLNTRAHPAGLQKQLTGAETPFHPLSSFFIIINLWTPLWTEAATEDVAVDLAEMVTELNFHAARV